MLPKGKVFIFQLAAVIFLTVVYYFFKGATFSAREITAGLFAVGLVIGVLILWADEKWLVKYYSGETDGVAGTGTTEHLITRSLLFILALLPLSLYILTSTGSSLGVGVLLGIISGLALEVAVLSPHPDQLRMRFLSQLKKEVSTSDTQWFVRLFLLFAVVISALVVF